MSIDFFVPGNPAPGGSKRAFVIKGRAVLTDAAGKRNKAWKQDVKAFAAAAMCARPLFDCPLAVTMAFTLLRPASVKESKRPYPTVKPDVLKLARSTEDAMTGVVWRDDCTTVDLILTKRYGDKPGCIVRVTPMETNHATASGR